MRGALLALVLVAAACGGGSSDAGGEVTPSGEDLFAERVIGTNPGCITCHSLEPGVVLLGPSLAAIGLEAADRVAGQDARTYLRNSIVDPDSFVVDGFDAGRMPDDWATRLSEAEVDALIDYLVTRTSR
jgi:mono/diheme cytochrome c family protein